MPSTTQKPDKWPFKLYHGDVWPAESFTLVDDASGPITGFTVKMEIKRSLTGLAVKTLTGGDGFTVASNLVTFDTIVDLLPGTYIHDIQVTLANGDIHTQYAGLIIVAPDATT